MLHDPLVVVDEQTRRSKGFRFRLSDLLVLDGRPDRVGGTRSELALIVDRWTAGPEVDGGRKGDSVSCGKEPLALGWDVGHPSVVTEVFAACCRLGHTCAGLPLLRRHGPLTLLCHDVLLDIAC